MGLINSSGFDGACEQELPNFSFWSHNIKNKLHLGHRGTNFLHLACDRVSV